MDVHDGPFRNSIGSSRDLVYLSILRGVIEVIVIPSHGHVSGYIRQGVIHTMILLSHPRTLRYWFARRLPTLDYPYIAHADGAESTK